MNDPKKPARRPAPKKATAPAIDIQETFNTALAHARDGRLSEAEAGFERLLTVLPDHAAIYYNLGNVLKTQGRIPEAIAAYERAGRLDPADADIYYNLGNAHTEAGQLTAAAACFRQAIGHRPEHADARFNLAQILMQLDTPQEAVEAYRNLLATAPGHYGAQLGLGMALKALGQTDAAIVEINRAAVLSPTAYEPLACLGDLYTAAGHPDRALDAYQRADALAPPQAELLNNLANAWYRLNRLDEAVAVYRRAVTLAPDNAAIWTNLGTTLHQQNQNDEAAECFRRAIALEPDHQVAGHLAAALTGQTTASAPTEYVLRLFNQYAPRFDDHLQNTLGYRVPAALYAKLAAVAGPDMRFSSGIDLGCGTGISAVPFRNATNRLIGVDISPEMVKEAAVKEVYDRIIVGEIHQILAETQDRFDLFIATDLFIYVGDLERLFEKMAAVALPGAWVVSSIELTKQRDYILRNTGRYAHSHAYMNQLANQFHMAIRFVYPHGIRIEAGSRIPGALYGMQINPRFG